MTLPGSTLDLRPRVAYPSVQGWRRVAWLSRRTHRRKVCNRRRRQRRGHQHTCYAADGVAAV